MTNTIKAKGPEFAKTVSAEGHEFHVDEEGFFHLTPEALEVLAAHGFVGIVEKSEEPEAAPEAEAVVAEVAAENVVAAESDVAPEEVTPVAVEEVSEAPVEPEAEAVVAAPEAEEAIAQ